MANPAPRRSIHDGDARAIRQHSGDPAARCFLAGLRLAEQALRDRVDANYDQADRSSGADRREANQRAAEAVARADYVRDLSIAAAGAIGQRSTRRGLRAMLARLVGAGEAG
ncbi:hypothetical protein [Falsiroseomonas selenitidurans]|uniref:Uncharacterized protein n=1 Tax=Falsiroseomonas selenitidurans TaxID=2716335 RepID=A0ABX1E8D3_9PROT|nr:hypothetical protein [Falsiroseomonas selenitidurans]NKC33466.1 hypothetical protein [Falsiroseomonas selenitidurans]